MMSKVLAVFLAAGLVLVAQDLPETAKSALDRAGKAWKEQRYAETEEAFLLASRLDPKDPSIPMMLASLLYLQPEPDPFHPSKDRASRIQRASAAYRKAIEIDPSPMAISAFANFPSNERIFQPEPQKSQFASEAESLFKRLLQLQPNDLRVLQTFGSLAFD